MRDLDPTCPQCAVQRMAPPEQLDWDEVKHEPLSAAGKPVDPRTLKEIA